VSAHDPHPPLDEVRDAGIADGAWHFPTSSMGGERRLPRD
jgi:hypothetical protein